MEKTMALRALSFASPDRRFARILLTWRYLRDNIRASNILPG
jgi:hypothetical protein